MASVMVIVSKAAFKNDVVTAEGKQGELGDVCPIPHYRSRHKSIDALQEGGALFLVTVRPPEQLWLCAVLESPRALSDGWYGEPNVVPITDISALHYRPYQLYQSLMLVQEYGVWDKVLFGTDYPFTTVNASIDGVRKLNDMLDGTSLPRLDPEAIEKMIYRDSLSLLGLE